MWIYQSYDDGRTNTCSRRTSSGQNPAFNLYLYIFIQRCIHILPYDVIASYTFLASLLQCIGQYLLCELYSNSHVLVHYIDSHFYFLFFVSIIGCYNYSYSAILNSRQNPLVSHAPDSLSLRKSLVLYSSAVCSISPR